LGLVALLPFALPLAFFDEDEDEDERRVFFTCQRI
jgi:hypothetical protein